uniref:histidine decarboxylase n=1 Tax=Pristiophorus japonicus TaxID=55135 RepID=UPI00398EC96E
MTGDFVLHTRHTLVEMLNTGRLKSVSNMRRARWEAVLLPGDQSVVIIRDTGGNPAEGLLADGEPHECNEAEDEAAEGRLADEPLVGAQLTLYVDGSRKYVEGTPRTGWAVVDDRLQTIASGRLEGRLSAQVAEIVALTEALNEYDITTTLFFELDCPCLLSLAQSGAVAVAASQFPGNNSGAAFQLLLWGCLKVLTSQHATRHHLSKTPAWHKIEEAIRQLKNKSSGADGIPAEALKRGEEALLPWIHDLISLTWKEEISKMLSKVVLSSVIELQYADDACICAHSEAELQAIINTFTESYESKGLALDIHKSKVLHTALPPHDEALDNPFCALQISHEYQKDQSKGKELVDYIAEYLSTVRERRVCPDVQPGYMRELLPATAPEQGESWSSIFEDIERVIMPGMVHWQSPHMHAYFPALNSWPSLLGDMLADAINCLGFTWASSPACTELEMNVMDWLAAMLGLPNHFLHHHPDSQGGGVLQSTVSESTLIALLAARKAKITEMKSTDSNTDDSVLNSRLVAYASDQAHSSVEKAGLITLVKIRFLQTDKDLSLRAGSVSRALEDDRRRGLVPFFLCATLGTTGVCAFDQLNELGPLCASECLWLHVDAAYAGTAFLCPEFRNFLQGIEYSDSFVYNPAKWMMVHFDCTAFWVKDKWKLQQTFSVNPVYLRHANTGAAMDFMHWQIPLSRRFRSLKLWFVIRSFGVEKLRAHVRHGTEMAKYFESLVRSDSNFEVPARRHLGLVTFRLRGANSMTEELLRDLTQSGSMYLVPATIRETFIIRFTVTSQFTLPEDILRDWTVIQQSAVKILLNSSKDPNGLLTNRGGCVSKKIQSNPKTGKRLSPAETKVASLLPKSEVGDLWCASNSEDLQDPFDGTFSAEALRPKVKPSSSSCRSRISARPTITELQH